MESIRFVLFESPLSLAVVFVLVNFVLLVYWRRAGRVRPLLIGLAAWAALMLLQAVVVTPRERAGAILNHIERDLLDRRVDALQRLLARDFAADGMDKEEFVQLVRDELARTRVGWLRRMAVELVRESGSGFTAEAGYLSDVETGQYRGTIRSRWRIDFRKEDIWRIREIQPISIDGVDVANWGTISR
jgi:hypothetical protein